MSSGSHYARRVSIRPAIAWPFGGEFGGVFLVMGNYVPLGNELCNGVVSLNYLDQGALDLRVGHARCCCQSVHGSIVPEPRIVYTNRHCGRGTFDRCRGSFLA
jgi:hypothetical protein